MKIFHNSFICDHLTRTKLPNDYGSFCFVLFICLVRMGKHYTVPPCKICSLPQGGEHTYLSLLLGLFATTTDSAFAYKHKNLVYLKERELVNK